MKSIHAFVYNCQAFAIECEKGARLSLIFCAPTTPRGPGELQIVFRSPGEAAEFERYVLHVGMTDNARHDFNKPTDLTGKSVTVFRFKAGENFELIAADSAESCTVSVPKDLMMEAITMVRGYQQTVWSGR